MECTGPGLLLGLLGQLSFPLASEALSAGVWCWLLCCWRVWRRRRNKKNANVHNRTKNIDTPITIPAIAPWLTWCLYGVGVGVVMGRGEWLMVTRLGLGFEGN